MLVQTLLVAALSASATASQCTLHSSHLVKGSPTLPIGLLKTLLEREDEDARELDGAYTGQQLPFLSPSTALPVAHTFDQLVSHDDAVPPPQPGATFKQRYWLDAQYYKPGGPVFLLGGGETSGANRIPFLTQGILRILAEATGGIGIIHEHRYYGKSFPVQNLTTDSYRYLTTLQSLQDEVYFAKNIILPGLEHLNLTAPHTPWIRIGGSYAGAQSAFARKLFPEVWWGAIASSAVTKAIVDYWEYYEPIRLNGPPECISRLINHTALIDSLLALHSPLVTSTLKSFFGLPNVTLDEDFVNALSLPLGSYQGQNWDPKVGSHGFQAFCAAIEQDDAPSSTFVSSSALEAGIEGVAHLLPHWPKDPRNKFGQLKSYAAFIRDTIASACPAGASQDECFGTDEYGGYGLEEAPWKSWSYQFCTEWGYFIASPPSPSHPSLISRLLKTDYVGQVCRKAFPAGELNRVPKEPNVTMINQYGGFRLREERLAYIDGSADPWLYATPHSPNAPHHGKRRDTLKRPFKLIPGGVHHWDENGFPPSQTEPPEIAHIHAEEVEFVKAWLREWKERGRWRWKGKGEWKEVGRWD
ncbi:hypothetical protein JCM8547_005394 [Rhodosporidiobolus lusitaniae]